MLGHKLHLAFMASLGIFLMVLCLAPVMDIIVANDEQSSALSAAALLGLWAVAMAWILRSRSTPGGLQAKTYVALSLGLASCGAACAALVPSLRPLGAVSLLLGSILYAQRKV